MQELIAQALLAAESSNLEALKAQIKRERVLSAFLLCKELDHWGVPIPAASVSTTTLTSPPAPSGLSH